MKILITKGVLSDVKSRKEFLARVHKAMTALLTEEPVSIEIDPDMNLEELSTAFRALSEIIDLSSDISRPPKAPDSGEEEEEDPADFWKG